MAIDGKITRTDDDAITGWIASLTFDVDITLTKNQIGRAPGRDRV